LKQKRSLRRELRRTDEKSRLERRKVAAAAESPGGSGPGGELTESAKLEAEDRAAAAALPFGPEEAPAKKGGSGGGGRVNTSAAEAAFGEEIRRLAQDSNLSETAVAQALIAGQGSLDQGAAQSVARKSALGRLGSLAGKDLTPKSDATNPLLSAIFGEDVPDVRLSQVALGAQPQTLIANITNNFDFKFDQEINGAGNPADVASQINRGVRSVFEDAISKSTKLAKVNFRR
jgi:hypothetical protein